MNAVQEESLGYPSQVVPSGTKYKEPNNYSNTMVYEFKSTDPCDPRNCQIRLPLLAEENLGIEESTSGSHLNQSRLQERFNMTVADRSNSIITTGRGVDYYKFKYETIRIHSKVSNDKGKKECIRWKRKTKMGKGTPLISTTMFKIKPTTDGVVL